ncbi:hypothetical protein PFISCL1PPCAC_27292, partial [Pristionchus fissidentatus]
ALDFLFPSRAPLIKDQDVGNFAFSLSPSAPSCPRMPTVTGVAIDPIVTDSEKEVKEEPRPIKEEPIDVGEEALTNLRQSIDLAAMNRDDIGAAATLLSLATGFDLTLRVPQGGQIDAESKDGIPLVHTAATATAFVLPDREAEDNIALLGSSIFDPALVRRRKSFSLRFSSSEEDEKKLYISHENELFAKIPPKRGRPMKRKYSIQEVTTDPKKRRLACNRDAALRYREKKKLATMDLKNEQVHGTIRNKFLMRQVVELNNEINIWKCRFQQKFNIIPKFAFEMEKVSRSSSISMSSTDSHDSEGSQVDRAELNRLAALKYRAKKKEELESLKKEEAYLTDRNASLQTQSMNLHAEILELRAKMGFGHITTTSDVLFQYL